MPGGVGFTVRLCALTLPCLTCALHFWEEACEIFSYCNPQTSLGVGERKSVSSFSSLPYGWGTLAESVKARDCKPGFMPSLGGWLNWEIDRELDSCYHLV